MKDFDRFEKGDYDTTASYQGKFVWLAIISALLLIIMAFAAFYAAYYFPAIKGLVYGGAGIASLAGILLLTFVVGGDHDAVSPLDED